jgi:hypothetical protein
LTGSVIRMPTSESVPAATSSFAHKLAIQVGRLDAPYIVMARCAGSVHEAFRELEATGPEPNARPSWSAALNRVRSLVRE